MEEISLKDFFIYLKHYIVAFIIAVVVLVGGVVIYDTQIKKPMYQAKTTVVIAKSDAADNAAATLNDVNASQKLTATYSEIAKSELVLGKVIDNLDLETSMKELSGNVGVKPVDDTSILSITVKNLNAEQSASIANEIAKVFTEEITKIYKLDNVSQLSTATTPEQPSNNTLVRDLILAAAVAILGVTGVAFLRFYLDDTVKHNDDIEKALGLTVMGKI